MKVLIKLVGLRSGGIETLLVNVCEQLRDRNIEFEFLTDKDKKEFYDSKLEELKIKKFALGIENISRWQLPFKMVIGIYRVLIHGHYDIVHINESLLHAVICAFLCRITHVKRIIIHSHTNSSSDTHNFSWRMNKVLKRLAGLLATDYVACSRHAAEWAFPKKIISSDKVQILNNGINVEVFKYNTEVREFVRNALGISSEQILIGHVGRFVKQKNQKFIVEIAKEINNRGQKNLKYILIGEGENFQEIKYMIDERELSEQFILYGATDRVCDLYQAMDLFLFPSICEGLGMVAIESQAAGLPTLCSAAIPSEANLSPLYKSLSIDNGVEVWVDTILSEIQRPTERKSMEQYIYENKYDFPSTVDKLYSIYKGGMQ